MQKNQPKLSHFLVKSVSLSLVRKMQPAVSQFSFFYFFASLLELILPESPDSSTDETEVGLERKEEDERGSISPRRQHLSRMTGCCIYHNLEILFQ